MNTFVIFKALTDKCIEKTENIKIITTELNLDEFKIRFYQNVLIYMNQIIDLMKPVHEASSKITTEDYTSEIETESLKVFSDLYAIVQDFEKKNFIFEVEGQYIDMRDYFYNKTVEKYEILYLNDWLQNKKQEVVGKPQY